MMNIGLLGHTEWLLEQLFVANPKTNRCCGGILLPDIIIYRYSTNTRIHTLDVRKLIIGTILPMTEKYSDAKKKKSPINLSMLIFYLGLGRVMLQLLIFISPKLMFIVE